MDRELTAQQSNKRRQNSYQEVEEALTGFEEAIMAEEKEHYLQQLVDYLTPLIKKKIRYYFGIVDQDRQRELLQEGYLRTIELILDFDRKRGVRFLGYMQRMLGCFFFDLRKAATKREVLCCFEEEYMEPEEDPEYGMVEVDDLLCKLSDKERRIIKEHVLGGRKLIRISEEMNISYTYAKELKRNALGKLKTNLRPA